MEARAGARRASGGAEAEPRRRRRGRRTRRRRRRRKRRRPRRRRPEDGPRARRVLQRTMFSATMPAPVERLARRYLRDAVRITIDPQQVTVPQIEQVAYEVGGTDKLDALARVLDVETPGSAIVFCGTRRMVDDVADRLAGAGLPRGAAARGHGPGGAGAGAAPLPGGADGSAGGDGRRGAGPGHRGGDPRGQLRRPLGPGAVRPPHRAHRAGGPRRGTPSPW